MKMKTPDEIIEQIKANFLALYKSDPKLTENNCKQSKQWEDKGVVYAFFVYAIPSHRGKIALLIRVNNVQVRWGTAYGNADYVKDKIGWFIAGSTAELFHTAMRKPNKAERLKWAYSVMSQIEYSSDGFVKRYPEPAEFQAALEELRLQAAWGGK